MRIRQKHSRAAFMAAASISGLGLATTVNAQTEEPIVEEVVVTGFRASLATALENKRESTQIIESVAAEDIGKFPDQNVAEALQRLSGVQIDRSNGQGTKVRIRGLEQNVTLLNNDIFRTGLELYTQGEGNFRETDSLEGIPSELLGGVDVYKSPNASQLEGGLGGIVNLKTRNRQAGVSDGRAGWTKPRRLEVHRSRRSPRRAAELFRAGISLRHRPRRGA
jgi:iron complex outermembrane receptor protein